MSEEQQNKLKVRVIKALAEMNVVDIRNEYDLSCHRITVTMQKLSSPLASANAEIERQTANAQARIERKIQTMIEKCKEEYRRSKTRRKIHRKKRR